MRQLRYAFLGFGLVLVVAAARGADDDAAARTLVEKALRAQGGAGGLGTSPGITVGFKGNLYVMTQVLPVNGTVASQGPAQQKIDIELDVAGQKFRVAKILNGDKGWNRLGDNTKEMTKEELAEAQEEAYAGWVATLLPLTDKQFSLSSVGEVEVDKRPALGVKVSSKDRRDVNLFFDKQSHLLVKTETRVKDETTGQEVTEESFMMDYKEVQGFKTAMKFIVKRDGKLFLEAEATEHQFVEKLDASVFAAP